MDTSLYIEEKSQDLSAMMSQSSTPIVKNKSKIATLRKSKEETSGITTGEMVDIGQGIMIDKETLKNNVGTKDVREIILDLSKLIFMELKCGRHCIRGRKGKNTTEKKT